MSNYPNKLDTDAELPVIADNISEIGAGLLNGLRSSVLALETALGTNPQGTKATLVDRLAAVLNDDGTIKAAALLASGLIALPITNSQIGATAAIQESKLLLNVPTLTLQSQISSNHVDILSLQQSVAQDIGNLASHILGTYGRHDGYEIDFGGLSGHSTISTVAAALNFIWGTFLDHKAATTLAEHNSSAISYTPSGTGIITATNVQDAITQTDGGFVEDRRIHNHSAHSDGISNDGYVALGSQAATNDASIKTTRYQTFGGGQDIIKIGHPNAASVKTKGFQAGAIISTASAFNIVVTIGTGITRTLAITGLHTSAYPAASSRVTLEGIVDYINQQAALLTNHFPISAYSSDDGELVIQHNIDRDDCTIQITAPGANSAISALGFSNVVGQTVSRIITHYFTVNGTPYSGLKVLASGSLNLSIASSVINILTDVTASGLNLFPNMLLHVYNHTTASANGTYHISQISPASPSPATSIGLSTTLSAGTFNFVIYSECFNTNFVGSPRVLDFYLDSKRDPFVSTRATVSFAGMGGINIVKLSRDFQAQGSASLVLATSGSQKTLTFGTGIATSFDTGFLGYVQVYDQDGLGYATCLITSTSPINGSASLTTFASQHQDDLLFLGTSYSDASALVEIPLDERNVGLVGNTAIGSEFLKGTIEKDISNLHSNGVIRGLTVSTSGTSVVVAGGNAYIAGRSVEVAQTTVLITGVATVDGTYNLVLTQNGKFEVYSDTSPGTSLSDILLASNIVAISQLVVSSGSVSSATDARIFIDHIDNKLPFSIATTTDGGGLFQTLGAANLYLQTLPLSKKRDVIVISNLTSSNTTFAANKHYMLYGSMTFSGTTTISDGTTVELFGATTFTGDVVLWNNSVLEIHAATTFQTSLICFQPLATVKLHTSITARNISLAEESTQIIGVSGRQVINFAGTQTGITVSSNLCLIENLFLAMPDVAFTIMDLQNGSDGLTVRNCLLTQDITVDETKWATISRSGIKTLSSSITVSDVSIIGCEFLNLAEGISTHAASPTNNTWKHWQISNCIFNKCGVGIYAENITNSIISDNFITFIKSNHVKFEDTSTTQSGCVISNNVFDVQSATSTNLIGVSLGTNATLISVSDNIFQNFTGTSAINLAVSTGNPTGIVINGNAFSGCTTSDNYLLNVNSTATGAVVVSDNSITSHTGNVLKMADGILSNNRIVSSYNLATVPPILISTGTEQPLVVGNSMSITTNQYVRFAGAAEIVGNKIITSSMVVDTLGTIGLILSSNTIVANDTGASVGLTINTSGGAGGATAGRHIISNNIIETSSTTTGISLPLGSFVFSNNTVFSASGEAPTQVLLVGDGTSSTIATYLISNNSFMADTGSNYAILINTNNVSVLGNFLNGTGMANQAILVQSGKSNIQISNNFLGGGGNGLLIAHADVSPNAFFVGANKNYTAAFEQGSVSALQASGTWGVNSNGLQVTAGGTLLIPLIGLPVGTQLSSVSVSYTTTVSASVAITILRRTSGGISTSTISSSATTAGTGFHTVSVSPSSTEYIKSGSDYLIQVVVGVSTTTIGQAVVNITY